MKKVAKELVLAAKDILAYRDDWVVSPKRIIEKALRLDLIDRKEANSRDVKDAAREEAESLRDSFPEGQGFGSSDMNHLVHSVLQSAGIPVDWVRGRLTRVAAKKGSLKTARQFEGYYELTNGSPAVWAMSGGTDDIEMVDVLDSFLRNANKTAEAVLRKAGVDNMRGWERKDYIYSSNNKVAGLVQLIGDPLKSYSILEALDKAGFKKGRP